MGLTLTGAGVLSGTPTVTGSYTFTVRAANGTSPDAVTPSRTIVVNAVTLNSADLRVTLDAPIHANRHDIITYVLTVHNDGPSSASNVRVTFALPDSGVFVSATPFAHPNNHELRWSLPTLAAGAEASFQIQVQVRRDSLRADGRARSDTPDPNLSNNRASAVTRVGGH